MLLYTYILLLIFSSYLINVFFVNSFQSKYKDYAIPEGAVLEDDLDIEYEQINNDTFNDEHKHILDYYENLEKEREENNKKPKTRSLVNKKLFGNLKYKKYAKFKDFEKYWTYYKKAKYDNENSVEGHLIKQFMKEKKALRFKRFGIFERNFIKRNNISFFFS